MLPWQLFLLAVGGGRQFGGGGSGGGGSGGGGFGGGGGGGGRRGGGRGRSFTFKKEPKDGPKEEEEEEDEQEEPAPGTGRWYGTRCGACQIVVNNIFCALVIFGASNNNNM